MNELVARIVQTLALIAGLLWSGVCAAECKVLPEPSQHVPPCHQKQNPSKQVANCSTAYEDVAKQDLAYVAGDIVALVVVTAAPPIFVSALPAAVDADPPPCSISVLRV
jgi:hypothetical protein